MCDFRRSSRRREKQLLPRKVLSSIRSREQRPLAKCTKRDTRQLDLIEAALAEGKSVIVDNTNPTPPAERAKIIEVVRARGARVVGYFFDVSTRVAVARNAERSAVAKSQTSRSSPPPSGSSRPRSTKASTSYSASRLPTTDLCARRQCLASERRDNPSSTRRDYTS
jgi:Zeta toxin.